MGVFKPDQFPSQFTERPHKLQHAMEVQTSEPWGERALAAHVVTTTKKLFVKLPKLLGLLGSRVILKPLYLPLPMTAKILLFFLETHNQTSPYGE